LIGQYTPFPDAPQITSLYIQFFLLIIKSSKELAADTLKKQNSKPYEWEHSSWRDLGADMIKLKEGDYLKIMYSAVDPNEDPPLRLNDVSIVPLGVDG